MKITIDSLGKQYRKDWIFKDLQYNFEAGGSYAILGPNGAGKSTLLQLINNNLTPTDGKVNYHNNGNTVDPQDVYHYLNFAAPYMELVEELSLEESIRFHSKFKVLAGSLNEADIIKELGMASYSAYLISEFSSGMKQRLKLALAFFFESEVLILDEPLTNLDEEGISWFNYLLDQHRGARMLLIGSNRPEEYKRCEHQLSLGK